MRRRLLLGAAVSLAGCGFELKRPPELNFKTIQLAGFAPRSQLAIELKQNIESGPTTRVVGPDSMFCFSSMASCERGAKPASWIVLKLSSGGRFSSKPQPARETAAPSSRRRRIRRRR